jgi:hypothetical protein
MRHSFNFPRIAGQFALGAVIGAFGALMIVLAIGRPVQLFLPSIFREFEQFPDYCVYAPFVVAALSYGTICAIAEFLEQRANYRTRTGQCEYCGYDLRGLDSNRCPECGGIFKKKGRGQ